MLLWCPSRKPFCWTEKNPLPFAVEFSQNPTLMLFLTHGLFCSLLQGPLAIQVTPSPQVGSFEHYCLLKRTASSYQCCSSRLSGHCAQVLNVFWLFCCVFALPSDLIPHDAVSKLSTVLRQLPCYSCFLCSQYQTIWISVHVHACFI